MESRPAGIPWLFLSCSIRGGLALAPAFSETGEAAALLLVDCWKVSISPNSFTAGSGFPIRLRHASLSRELFHPIHQPPCLLRVGCWEVFFVDQHWPPFSYSRVFALNFGGDNLSSPSFAGRFVSVEESLPSVGCNIIFQIRGYPRNFTPS
jgi:hypothetical protein